MVKRFITIWLLLSFSVFPVLAQSVPLAELIRGAITQADDDEVMACCAIAGQCKMAMPEESACQSLADVPMPCICDTPEPDLPLGVPAPAPQLPTADDTLVVLSPLTKWAEFLPINARPQSKAIPRATQVSLRRTCLRI